MSRPRVLSIASAGNGSGKTSLAVTLLRAFPGAFTALKFTTVYRDGDNCPRTEVACACRELHGPYTILAEPAIVEQEGTDTGRMARAGAARTLWCLSIPSAHPLAWEHLTSRILAPDERLVTEGNRAVGVMRPDALVLVLNPDVPRGRWKSDTWDLAARADLIVINAFGPAAPTAGAVTEVASSAGAVASSVPAAASSAAALEREVRRRCGTVVLIQDVAAPLERWAAPDLANLAARILAPAAS